MPRGRGISASLARKLTGRGMVQLRSSSGGGVWCKRLPGILSSLQCGEWSSATWPPTGSPILGFLARILASDGAKVAAWGRPYSALAESGAPKPEAHGGPLPARLGPSVRKLIMESGLDLSQISGTGPKGYIVKGDLLAAMLAGGGKKQEAAAPPQQSKAPAEQRPPPPAPRAPPKGGVAAPGRGEFEELPNSQIRRVIAKRLVESKSLTPHYFVEAEAVVDATLELRRELKAAHGASVSVNDFVIKATAMALKQVPEANSYWDEKREEIVDPGSIDISVAVATDKGLMTPIVKNADTKSLATISAEVKALAEKARSGKLKPEEFQGGTFCISNLGMYSIDRFAAIINPPQPGILAVGRGEKVARWQDNAEGGGGPATVTKMELTLSGDARALDYDTAGKFLDALSALLAHPHSLLL